MIKEIGFIGLGTIGKPMAINLSKGNYSLTVYDVDPKESNELVDRGVKVAKSPAEACRGKDLVILIIPQKEEKSLLLPGKEGLLENIDPGTLLVDMGSHSLEATLQLAHQVSQRKVMFLDAPVWGTKDKAVNGLLTILTGGQLEHVSLCREVFLNFGLNIIHVGKVGDGTRMKFIVDMLQAQLVEALVEGFVLGEKLGFKIDKILEVLESGGVASPLLHTKGRAIARGNFSRNLALKYIYGNLLYVQDAAQKAEVQLPAAEAVLKVFEKAIEQGYGEEDFSAVAKVLGK